MAASDWQGKRIVIVGLARQGKALARYLAGQGASVVVSDTRSAEELATAREELAGVDVEYVFGGHPESLLDGADGLCLSGGVPADLPLAETARQRGLPVTNDGQIFLEASPATSVGITGSAGKSTTTAMVGAMAQAAGRTTWVGGNLGRPLLLDLAHMNGGDVAVLELSSFQLELMTTGPQVAVVLNVTPNHLDRHGTMDAYLAAKARILDFQPEDGVAVLGQEDQAAWGLRNRVRGRLLSFGWSEPEAGEGAYLRGGELWLLSQGGTQPVIAVEDVSLLGDHNLLNTLAACAIGLALDLPAEAMRQAIARFAGLPHRLELISTVRQAHWVNDSIATTPERAIAGMRAFKRPLVLLAGGRDKGLAWATFAQVAAQRARHVITFGEAANTIAEAVQAVGGGAPQVTAVADLETAVQTAAELVHPGEVVLLSPGGTSFDAFTDFEARGDRFRQLVEAL
ncbi:MAG TPA: UDP-N-acetylmuramoyl-L-alanine--D-glutamate ligase [Anaerolineales bacterium]